MTKKQRYIVFERDIGGDFECMEFSRYQSGQETLFYKDTVELDEELAEEFRAYYWNSYVLVRVVNGEKAQLLVDEIEAKMRSELEQRKVEAEKKQARAAKASKTRAENKKKKELEQLKKLQEKYEKEKA